MSLPSLFSLKRRSCWRCRPRCLKSPLIQQQLHDACDNDYFDDGDDDDDDDDADDDDADDHDDYDYDD